MVFTAALVWKRSNNTSEKRLSLQLISCLTYTENFHFLQGQFLHAGWVLWQNNNFLHGASICRENKDLHFLPTVGSADQPSAASPVPRNSTS